MGAARSDDAVDRSIDTGIAHLQPCVAHLLLGRTHGGLRGDVFGRILVELRLTDGVDTRQRHGAFVVVAGRDLLRTRRFERSFGRKQGGGEQVGVDRKEQLPLSNRHTAAEILVHEIAVDTGFDQCVEIAFDTAHEAHAVGDGVRRRFDHLDAQGGLRSGCMPAAATACQQRRKGAKECSDFVH